MTAVLVLAKAPVPGRVKTRLCPPCTPAEAAVVAEAALRDTLDAASASMADERVLVLDGRPGPWLPPGWRVVRQPDGDLNTRLSGAFAAVREPAVLVGMDTPQLRPRDLDDALAALRRPDCDAVLGPSLDGGYWSIGFDRQVCGAFDGVPMSSCTTYAVQHARLRQLGLRVGQLLALRDVDRYADAVAVAHSAPQTRLARALAVQRDART